jgi:hypothetical protein
MAPDIAIDHLPPAANDAGVVVLDPMCVPVPSSQQQRSEATQLADLMSTHWLFS